MSDIEKCNLYTFNSTDPFHIGNTYGGLPTNLVKTCLILISNIEFNYILKILILFKDYDKLIWKDYHLTYLNFNLECFQGCTQEFDQGAYICFLSMGPETPWKP